MRRWSCSWSGPAQAFASIGSMFYAAHFALFVLGTPALANVLVFRSRGDRTGRWYVAAPICTAFAIAMTLMQYAVSEAIYGVS